MQTESAALMPIPGHIDPVPVPREFKPRADGRIDLLGLSKADLRMALETAQLEPKQAKLRAKQLWHWIYNRGVTEFALMTDISKAMQPWLEQRFVISRPEVVEAQVSTDGTRKWLLRSDDGQDYEMVFIPDADRGTLCVSSQVGCTLNCRFCHTGTMRLVRNLLPGEIVGQVMLARDALGEWPSQPEGRMLTNIVMMGMARRAKRNVAHHYDLSRRLYDLFLDADRQYSCAYYTDPANSLEQAQLDKKAHIAAKLAIEPGMRVLDIGCGWGGMALYLHEKTGAEVVGITLSEEQLKVARERAAERGVHGKVRFELIDYREMTGQFDRIVSVGMFEHVGTPQYRTFFHKCRELLTPEGVMLLHTIGRAGGPGVTDAFTLKYIFPGGYIPALSEITKGYEGLRYYMRAPGSARSDRGPRR